MLSNFAMSHSNDYLVKSEPSLLGESELSIIHKSRVFCVQWLRGMTSTVSSMKNAFQWGGTIKETIVNVETDRMHWLT